MITVVSSPAQKIQQQEEGSVQGFGNQWQGEFPERIESRSTHQGGGFGKGDRHLPQAVTHNFLGDKTKFCGKCNEEDKRRTVNEIQRRCVVKPGEGHPDYYGRNGKHEQ